MPKKKTCNEFQSFMKRISLAGQSLQLTQILPTGRLRSAPTGAGRIRGDVYNGCKRISWRVGGNGTHIHDQPGWPRCHIRVRIRVGVAAVSVAVAPLFKGATRGFSLTPRHSLPAPLHLDTLPFHIRDGTRRLDQSNPQDWVAYVRLQDSAMISIVVDSNSVRANDLRYVCSRLGKGGGKVVNG